MSPFSLRVHAAVAPDATPRVGGVGGAAVCARAVVWTRLTSAGTRSVRRADPAAMAIPLWAAAVERAAPISPHLTPERKTEHPSREPGFRTCIAGVVSYAWSRGSSRRSGGAHQSCVMPEERVELSRGCPRGILRPGVGGAPSGAIDGHQHESQQLHGRRGPASRPIPTLA